jgi:hypothetical protein
VQFTPAQSLSFRNLPPRNLHDPYESNPYLRSTAEGLEFPAPNPHHPDGGQIPALVKKAIAITPGIEPLYGTRDENLHLLEAGMQVQIDIRSDAIHVTGDETAVGRTAQVFADFDALRKGGVTLQNGELNALLKLVVADPRCTLRQLYDAGKQRSAGVKRAVQPRSANQKKYVEAIEAHDMTFGLGPAGTGKTYLAVAMAVSALMAKKVSRIILVRPAVEAGEGRPLPAPAVRRSLRPARPGEGRQAARAQCHRGGSACFHARTHAV